MAPIRQTIYFLILIVLIASLGLTITKLATDNYKTKQESEINKTVSANSNEIQKVDWNTAAKLMADCKVKVIFQKHTLEVNLRTHDHQVYQTTEPKIDAIFDLAKKYQGPCDIVQMITE